MTPQFIEEFSFLLDSGRDGIEVSYNAAGVLSHIASDGLAAWTVEAPDREHVLERLVRAVNRCKLVLHATDDPSVSQSVFTNTEKAGPF